MRGRAWSGLALACFLIFHFVLTTDAKADLTSHSRKLTARVRFNGKINVDTIDTLQDDGSNELAYLTNTAGDTDDIIIKPPDLIDSTKRSNNKVDLDSHLYGHGANEDEIPRVDDQNEYYENDDDVDTTDVNGGIGVATRDYDYDTAVHHKWKNENTASSQSIKIQDNSKNGAIKAAVQRAQSSHTVLTTADRQQTQQHNPFNLPSFESTPIPPRIPFAEWQKSYRQRRHKETQLHLSRIHGDVKDPKDAIHPSTSSPHGYEFTSRYTLIANKMLKPNYVGACIVVRDAHDDIGEWIHHHLRLNVSKIYVYDHDSTPPMERVLKPWITSGHVVYHRIGSDEFLSHPSKKPQLYGYDQCLRDHGPAHTWLMFIDVDEYLMFQSPGGYNPIQNLPNLLQQYESYSALAVHWILYGSSGRETRPDLGTLRSYTTCVPRNHTYHLYVKTIANTACTIGTSDSPHVFRHNCTKPAVRTNFAPVYAQTADDLPDHSTIVLHHYATRSAEEFEVKMARGSGMKRQRGWEYFYFVDKWSVHPCPAALHVFDSNVLTMPRTLDPGTLDTQLSKYGKEEHEEFWGKKTRTTTVGVVDAGNDDVAAFQHAGKAAVAATLEQAEIQADQWGKENVVDDVETDEDGGERDEDNNYSSGFDDGDTVLDASSDNDTPMNNVLNNDNPNT